MGWNRSLEEYSWPSREGEDRAKGYDPRSDGARCDICPLAGQPVVPSAPPKSGRLRLIVVGEGPGRVEERWRLPFIGPTGAYFNKLIEENAGDDLKTRVSRDDMHVTNTMLCRGESDKDNATAAACCAPRLLKELAALPREVPILALGPAAAQATLGVRSILLSRGFVWDTKPIEQTNLRAAARAAEKGAKGEDIRTGIPKGEILKLRSAILAGRAAIAGRRVFPALHPAFVLRLETWAPILEIDIDRCFRAVRGEELVLRDRGQYRVVSKRENIHRELARLGGVVSTDVETDGKDPLTTKLVCVGVSDGVRTVVVHPGAGKIRGKTWKPFASEALSQFFKNCRAVVMHNGYNFDQVVLRQHGVDFTGVQLEDTLLAHHAFASHLPKKLDQVVSEYVDSGAWKVKHGRRGSGGGSEEKGLVPHKMPAKEVCLYNAADCRLTTIAWEGMQSDLEEEREVYEHDKQISVICQQMLYDGIYMDRDRRAEVRRAMRKRGIGLKKQMRELLRAPDFVPMRTADVRWALFSKLKAPVFDFTPTGLPATSAATLEELRKMEGKVGKFCDLLLNWRVVEKVRGTYLEAIPISADGRVHYSWRPYGTVSGRWACRFQSLPRKTKEMLPEDRMGECYAAPPGWDYHYFDLSQSEMRAAAYISADPEFMRVAESGDVHAGNASILFPKQAALGYLRGGSDCPLCKDKQPHEVDECSNPKSSFGKGYRDIAKNAGFGILYSAEINTIFGFLRGKGFDVQREDVVTMFDEIHRKYAVYYDYCNENIGRCRMAGHLRTALMGRIRWLGWYPKPSDVYNFPIQSFIADLMNIRLIELRRRLPRRVKVVAQIHDALVLEARQGRDSRVTGELIRELWQEPVRIPTNGLEFVMPIDQKRGERLIEFR